MLANLIASGQKSPDVFISVDPQVVVGLGPKVARAETFARTSLGLGWSDKSRFASLFNGIADGKTTELGALQTPRLKIGRTDPALDLKGEYTIQAMRILAGVNGERKLLGSDANRTQTFPEESLLARIQLGETDVGFLYRTEAIAGGVHFVPLLGAASMSDKITYTIALLKGAPHPGAAKGFWDFILTGNGKEILQNAGVEYLATPRVVVAP